MKQHYILIGIDDNEEPQLSAEVRQLIGRSRRFSGGARHYEIVRSLLPEKHTWIGITVPLSRVFEQYDRCFSESDEPMVVFVSGDPLFFGFGNTIQRERPEASIRLFPYFNSLQLLAHRIPMRYDDLCIVSLTGRPWQELDRALIGHAEKIGVLTDRQHTPATIAQRLLSYGYCHYRMYVGEHLGNREREQVRLLSLEEAAEGHFEMPNNLILLADQLPPRPFGIPDEDFAHLNGRSRMITKMPIRLLSLQAMDLPRRQVLWDVGFCTGSISIEARLQFPHLTICSFEIRPECEALMETNCRRMGAPGIQSFIGDFLQTDISSLPAPDAIFIGGHGGKMREIVARLAKVMQPDGCIVFNSVSAESLALFEAAICEAGLQLVLSRHIALDDYNPITILKAVAPSVTDSGDNSMNDRKTKEENRLR